MNQALSDFAARLRALIAIGQPAIAKQQFAELALDLFALQFRSNSAYRKICRAQGATPGSVEHWTQIPIVPTSAFKELELSCIPPEERASVFHSSGTTTQKPSRHFHGVESLALYEASSWRWFLENVLPDLQFKRGAGGAAGSSPSGNPPPAIFLTPPPAQTPRSSLVYMLDVVRRRLGAPATAFVGKINADGAWELNYDALRAALAPGCQAADAPPLLLLGTAFSFVHLLDWLGEQNLAFKLPPGSRVMETGGYKNRSRAMSKMELHALIAARLGVPIVNIICEYGMSELSSQAYDGEKRNAEGGGRSFCFPPWAAARIISPETGREAADGQAGLIRVCDLANVFSVAAIQTEDLGIRRGAGFELVGRASPAEARGCSLMNA
ncbi:MAG: long-chain fatty acid--CoA ligase [Verrucomicrobiota bacterium]|nr:long-chain fatty acid--CoA ligase [Verrucomicrobiota bacterium]